MDVLQVLVGHLFPSLFPVVPLPLKWFLHQPSVPEEWREEVQTYSGAWLWEFTFNLVWSLCSCHVAEEVLAESTPRGVFCSLSLCVDEECFLSILPSLSSEEVWEDLRFWHLTSVPESEDADLSRCLLLEPDRKQSSRYLILHLSIMIWFKVIYFGQGKIKVK